MKRVIQAATDANTWYVLAYNMYEINHENYDAVIEYLEENNSGLISVQNLNDRLYRKQNVELHTGLDLVENYTTQDYEEAEHWYATLNSTNINDEEMWNGDLWIDILTLYKTQAYSAEEAENNIIMYGDGEVISEVEVSLMYDEMEPMNIAIY